MTDLQTHRADFALVLRGYDREQVDTHIRRLQERLAATDERVHQLERAGESVSSPLAVGPRVSEIFELAVAEANDVVAQADRRAEAIIADAQAEAEEIIDEAHDTAEQITAECRGAQQAILDQFQREHERMRAQVGELDRQRLAMVGELRRLYEALGVAAGIAAPAASLAPRLPAHAEVVEGEAEIVEPLTARS